jgi:hypothetical protein
VVKTAIRIAEHRRQASKSLRVRCPRGAHGNAIVGRGKKRDIVARRAHGPHG